MLKQMSETDNTEEIRPPLSMSQPFLFFFRSDTLRPRFFLISHAENLLLNVDDSQHQRHQLGQMDLEPDRERLLCDSVSSAQLCGPRERETERQTETERERETRDKAHIQEPEGLTASK